MNGDSSQSISDMVVLVGTNGMEYLSSSSSQELLER